MLLQHFLCISIIETCIVLTNRDDIDDVQCGSCKRYIKHNYHRCDACRKLIHCSRGCGFIIHKPYIFKGHTYIPHRSKKYLCISCNYEGIEMRKAQLQCRK